MKAIIQEQRRENDSLRAKQHKEINDLLEGRRHRVRKWKVKYHDVLKAAETILADREELESDLQKQQQETQKLKSGMQEQQEKMQKLKEDKDILLNLMFHKGLEERVKDCNHALAQQMWEDLLQESNSTDNGEGPE